MLNVHGSILPKWRGAAPIPHSIMNGDTSTGISIMRIRPLHFDVGEVLATRECLIENDEHTPELSVKLGKIGAQLMLDVLKDLKSYEALSQKQPSEGVTYGKKENYNSTE